MTVDRETLTDALYDAGLDEDAVREDYSGRAMYGSTCLGIVAGAGELLRFAAALGASGDDLDWLGGVRSDSLGLGTIWYWPGVSVEESS